MSFPAAVYRPRNPQLSDYYHCIEDYFDAFVGIYDEHFSRQYGFWRPYVEQVIYRYLDAACPVPDTGAICTTVLSVSNAKIAATNISWPSPASGVIAVQTFGDFLGFNPHCHILVTDGCFLRQAQDGVYGWKGMFRVAPSLELKKLETIFQHYG